MSKEVRGSGADVPTGTCPVVSSAVITAPESYETFVRLGIGGIWHDRAVSDEPHAELHPWNTRFRWVDADQRPKVATSREHALTSAQLEAFDRDGYFVLDDVVTDADLAALRADLDPVEAEAEAAIRTLEGERFGIAEADAITFVPHLVTRSEVARRVAASPRIALVAGQLLGPDVRLYWDQLVYKKPQKPRRFPWHQDNGYTFVTPQQYLTVWLALTDAAVGDGCPWVVPGMHRRGTLEHRWIDPLGFQCLDDPPGAVPAEVRAGSAVVFSSLTPHLTGPNTSDSVRRTYILQYAPDGAQIHAGDASAGPATSVEPANDPQRQFFVLQGGSPTH
jgi:ectoine hydroxylase-related dioxygenase (phytanoyl-CoA dioxygenase family)